MKARWWLLLAAAGLLLPSAAHAQKKKPKAAPAAAPAPAAGGEIELDAPATPPPGAPAADQNAAQPGAAPAAEAPAPEGGATTGAGGAPSGGICEIDPSACPKAEDIAKAAKRPLKNFEVYAVEQIYALRRHRLELNPYWGFTLNDQFVSHPGPGMDLKYYVTNVLAVGLNGNWYGGLNEDSDFNFTYVPVYGKFAGFNEFIFSYDIFVVGGLGAISTRPIPVIDPDDRTFQFQPKLDFDLGIGLRIFLNRWFAATLEVRDYIYEEKLENLTVGPSEPLEANGQPQPGSAQDPNTWLGNGSLTNNVQAQVGLSIFLPFSWEYRLPK